jgi:hypothetical protein
LLGLWAGLLRLRPLRVILAQVQFQHPPVVVPEPAQRAGADDGRHVILPQGGVTAD